MKVAVISDIHANLPALETVLAAIDEAGVDQIWCLGDAVGYGADPVPCIDLLADRCEVCLAGNHDLAVLDRIELSTFSPSAAAAVVWTRGNLGDDGLSRLAALVGEAADEREGIGLYHGSPRDPVWEYVIEPGQAEDCLDIQPQRVALVGHSHVAVYFIRIDELARVSSVLAPDGTEAKMDAGRWLVNPGSVGQPRDGDPRAAWMELETGSMTARFHRVEYPVDAAAEAIRKAGLPDHLADRLHQGH